MKLDTFIFSLLVFIFFGAIIFYTHKKALKNFGSWSWKAFKYNKWFWAVTSFFGVILASLILVGFLGARYAANIRLKNIQTYICGIAPTLAYELEQKGHETLTLRTSQNDSTYLEMDKIVEKWQLLNQTAKSMYTIKRFKDKRYLMLSPAADLNKDRKIKGVLEEKDPLGTPYPDNPSEMEKAFQGQTVFQAISYTDKWGKNFSVYTPLHDKSGKVDGIFAIDFDANDIEKQMLYARIDSFGRVGIFIIIVIFMYYFIVNNRFEVFKQTETSRKLEELASTDLLTGILNRRGFEDIFSYELARIAHPWHAGLIIFDIDFFKRINDTLGHNMGDLALQKVAETIKGRTRQSDKFARWGGDEFVILSLDCQPETLKIISEKAREAIANLEYPSLPKITCSFGVSLFIKGDTLETLIKRADDSLYDAKQNGRNCVGKLLL